MIAHKNKTARTNSVNLESIDEIVYWTKKWEISPRQLLSAVRATNSNNLVKIREYLVDRGFAI